VALKWCMTSPSYVNRLHFFMAIFGSGFRLKLRSVTPMVSSKQCFLEDEIEQSLLNLQLLIRVVVTMMTQVEPII
jgi:hypothetical protein